MIEDRRYGQWGGNPKGFAYDPQYCCEEVWRGTYKFGQCTRKRGNGPDALYCKQHAKIKEKQNDHHRQAPRGG